MNVCHKALTDQRKQNISSSIIPSEEAGTQCRSNPKLVHIVNRPMTEHQASSRQRLAGRQSGVVNGGSVKSAMPTPSEPGTLHKSNAQPESQTSGGPAQEPGNWDQQAEPFPMHTPKDDQLEDLELLEGDVEQDLREPECISEEKRAQRRK